MRALILSDLHIEHAPFEAPPGDYDLVILAGDIHNGTLALRWARETFAKYPIIQIAGNHEYYDHVFEPLRAEMREVAGSLGIHYLDDSDVVLGQVQFLGCTLWTDFRVFETPGRGPVLTAEQAMQANRSLMADYFAIRVKPERTFEPADSLRLHQASLAWLRAELAKPTELTRVVVSHHLPSWRSVSQRYATSVSNAAFVSDLDDLVALSDWWIHGHTHSSHCYEVESAQLLSNPRGYPRRKQPGVFENPDFRADLIIDLAAPPCRLT